MRWEVVRAVMNEVADVLSGKSRWARSRAIVSASWPRSRLIASSWFSHRPRMCRNEFISRTAKIWALPARRKSGAAWMQTVYAACLRVCPGLAAMVVEGSTNDFRYDCAPALLMADLCRAGVCLRKPPIYRRFWRAGQRRKRLAQELLGVDYLRHARGQASLERQCGLRPSAQV